MRFAIYLLALLAVVAFAMGWPTRVGITGHEGDLFHMIDAGLRMSEGEIPHLDFMTPLGILSIAPVALFLSLGFAGGKAALLSNLLVTVLLTPAIWWVGQTRLSGLMRLIFGAAMVILGAALIYGGTSTATSLSMYYNRWCWVVVFCMLVAVLWPARYAERGWGLALLLGLGLSALALTKMTFFIAFAPPIGLILLAQRRFFVLAMLAGIGAIVFALTTLLLGIPFWQAYANDLLQVALHSQRSQPGDDLSSILSAPKFIAGSVALVAAIIWLRKSGHLQLGLYLLLLAPAFVLTTWQNWGNDPKWLFLVGFIVAANLPISGKMREVGIVISTAAFVALAPTMLTLTTSLSRGLFVDWTLFAQITPSGPLSDVWLRTERLAESDVIEPIEGLPGDAPLRVFNGLTIPDCRSQDGLVRLAQAYSTSIHSLPNYQGKAVFMADLLNLVPLISDVPRLKGGAPWYYGADPGFADAGLIILPKCPLSRETRSAAMDALEAADFGLDLVLETPQMFLFAVRRGQ